MSQTETTLLKASAVSLILGVAKAGLALATGSHVVLASAVDSLGDAVVSLSNHGLARYAAQPADEGHPYGHGKVEALAGLGQVLFLVAGAGWVATTAIKGLLGAARTAPLAGSAMIGLVASMLVSAALARMLKRAGKEQRSLVLSSDAVHYQMDAISGIAALIGLAVTRLTGHAEADDVAALCVSALMVPSIIGLAREVLAELVDSSLPAEELTAIEAVLQGTPGLLGWHALRTRKSGRSKFIELHVVLDGTLTLAEGHRRADALEAALRVAVAGADVIIHVDVDGEPDNP